MIIPVKNDLTDDLKQVDKTTGVYELKIQLSVYKHSMYYL